MSKSGKRALEELETALRSWGLPHVAKPDREFRHNYLDEIRRMRGIIDPSDFNGMLLLELATATRKHPADGRVLLRALWRVRKRAARELIAEEQIREAAIELGGRATPESADQALLLADLLDAAAARLRPLQIRILELLVVSGKSKGDTARELGIAPSTLTYHVTRIREAIHPLLRDSNEFCAGGETGAHRHENS